MSIIRLSCVKDMLFAPTNTGNLIDEAYNKRRLLGRMEQVQRPKLLPEKSLLQHYLDRQLVQHAAELSPEAPVLLMVHGFLFDPRHFVAENPKDSDNPHSRVFHFKLHSQEEEQRHHTTSWPRHLGFSEDDGGAKGLALAFGWLSSPGFASSLLSRFKNFYSRAYDYAGLTSWLLVNVLEAMHRSPLLEDREFDLITHSLGSRVVIRALATAAQDAPHLLKRVGRICILGGAEYVIEASLLYRRLLNAEDNGFLTPETGPVIYNVVSRENDVLDILGENFGPMSSGDHNVIGHNGLNSWVKADRWLDVQIDSKTVQDWFWEQHNIEISGDRPWNVWDHWYYYTFHGNMGFYRRIFRDRKHWHIRILRSQGFPDGALGMLHGQD